MTRSRHRWLGTGGRGRGEWSARTARAGRLVRLAATLVLAVAGAGVGCVAAAAEARPGTAMSTTVLDIREAAFTVNGQPTFLLGISYYGALGAPAAFGRQDLDDMQRWGFNWLRVWATWAAYGNDVSAVDTDGGAREPYLGELADLVADCDRRGLIVDVTLSRGNGVTGPARLPSTEALRRAAEILTSRLAPWRNWYLDMANERNIRDRRYVGADELRTVRDAVKRLDPARLVTASHAGGELDRPALAEYLDRVRVDFVAPHRPRTADSPRQTEARTRELLAWMAELGRVVPVHHQEPFRRGYPSGAWVPTASDFLTDLAQAVRGGAAGWCFHNGGTQEHAEGRPRRSFDLREERLFESLDTEERRMLEGLAQARRGPMAPPGGQGTAPLP